MKRGFVSFFASTMLAPAVFLAMVVLFSCTEKPEIIEQPPLPPYNRITGEAIDGVRIAWNYSSLQNPTGGAYARLRRLQDQSLMIAVEVGAGIQITRSYNNGKTWSSPRTVLYNRAVGSARVNLANAELYQLANGVIVVGGNGRPNKDNVTPWTIEISRSLDNGATWLPRQVLYEAGIAARNGCWEPAFLQLPNGELQVYFANEAPYTSSDEQEISMLSSSDNGVTWTTTPRQVCFRAGRRDGMPVPILVNDEIVVAIEDNKVWETMKPYVVRNKISENWQTPVLANSPYREQALTGIYDHIHGAPYIVTIPSGEVILSHQTPGDQTSSTWLCMEVAIGDKTGRNFGKLTQPFVVPRDQMALWNALALWDEHNIVAVTNQRGIRTILGRIIPELTAPQGNITVDGNISEAEWGSHLPVFIGHERTTNMNAAIKHNADNLFLCAQVSDTSVYSSPSDIQEADGVFFYIDAGDYKLTAPDEGIFKIRCNNKGNMEAYQGNRGEWKKIPEEGLVAKTASLSGGYAIELQVPLSFISKTDMQPVRINFGLKEYSSPNNAEYVVHTKEDASHTWCKVDLK